MKITSVEAIYPNYQQPLTEWRSHLWQIVVRVQTDVGITGLGYGGGGIAACAVVNHHLCQLLDGRQLNSNADIATIWDELYQASIPYGRKGVAIMALSGVDLALWDLLAKAEKAPVYKLLAEQSTQPTPKEKMRAYATGTDAVWYHELGFTAYKSPHRWTGDPADYARAVATMSQARSLFGDEAMLMIDCYMTWDADVTMEMAKQLAPYRITWFEDALTPDERAGQAALRNQIKPIQLAGGEHEFTHHGFAEIARAEALDIWQPDITWCGGLTAGLRIVELAQHHGARVIPHRGGEVWGLHLVAATSCDDLAELLPGQRQAPVDPLWLGQPMPENGYLSLPDAPGFGVQLNEAFMP